MLVSRVFLFILVFGDGSALEFLFEDWLHKSEAEVQLALYGTGRTGDEEIHVGVAGLAEVDCAHGKQGRAECDKTSDENKAAFLVGKHQIGYLAKKTREGAEDVLWEHR